jgi:hypothetical protein
MRSQATFVVALVVSAGLSVQLMAGKPASSTPVTSTIVDDASYQIGSDGLGPYKNGSSVRSEILANGDYQMGGFYVAGSTRTVALDLAGAGISGTGPNGGAPVPVPNGLYNVNIASDCANIGLSYLKVAPGTTIECGMNVHFAYGGQTYDLHQTPLAFSETNPVSITCTSAVGGPCSAWTVQPSAASGYDVANLSIEKTAKGKLTYVKQGDFLVSFLIHVTNP